MILSIETATELCGAAIVRGGACIAERTVGEKNIHSERLMVLVDEVLNEAGASVQSLRGIAVSIGPGSFTGLRIGLSAAKGLAFARSLPLAAVPTLDALAEEALRQNAAREGDIVCPLIDAKRDEAYYAFYLAESATQGGDHADPEVNRAGASAPRVRLRQLTPYAILSTAAIADEARKTREGANGARRIVFAGDGAQKMVPFAVRVPGAVLASGVICSPAAVGLVAERRFGELSAAGYEELEPQYIRDFVTTAPRVANQTAIP